MQSAVKKFGNSAGVIIPKPFLAELGAEAGDSVEMRIEGGKLIIERAKPHPRAGWAEDAAAIAEAGDDEFVWEGYVAAEGEDDEWTW